MNSIYDPYKAYMDDYDFITITAEGEKIVEIKSNGDGFFKELKVDGRPDS